MSVKTPIVEEKSSSVEIEMSVFSDKTPQRNSSYAAQEEQDKATSSRNIP